MKKPYFIAIILLALVALNCKPTKPAPETLADLPSQYLALNDSVDIHYKIAEPCFCSSVRQTICFVHGFGCDINTWEKQYEAFRNYADVRQIFIDLPGYGLSSKPHVDYTLDYYSDAVEAVLAQYDTDQVILVGHSLGTPICRRVAMKSSRHSSIVDVDGVYCFFDENTTDEYREAVSQFGAMFDGEGCGEVIKGFVESLSGPATPKSIVDYAMSTMPNTPEYVASSTMHNLVDTKWWNGKIFGGPAMVFCTRNSGIDPDNEDKMRHLYPSLDYIELDTCGHFIHMELPTMFNDNLKMFVTKLDR